MKKRSDRAFLQQIQKFSPKLGGVFTTSDLLQLLQATNRRTAELAINRLIEDQILARVKRGLFVTENFNPLALIPKLEPESYLSLTSVLAPANVVGTQPQLRYEIVTTKNQKDLFIQSTRFLFYKIQPSLFFSYEPKQSGIKIASLEKAYLDLLYFYQHGRKFAINPITDPKLDLLNQKKVMLLLKKYKNPKFVQFVKGIFDDHS